MTDDGRLLEQWTGQQSQAAFSALVMRHLNFVYSVCPRETQDAVLAEDVTTEAHSQGYDRRKKSFPSIFTR